MSTALRSFSRRKLSPKWFCKSSSSSPPLVLLHHDVKDYNTKPTFSDSSILIARSFHRQVFFEDRKKMSFGQTLGASSGEFLCSRHISSSSSKPAEEWSIKIDALGAVVPEKSVEAMVTTIHGSSAAMECLSPVYCAQYVINGIHDFTGLNWSMSVFRTALLASGLMYPVSVHIQRQVRQLKNMRMRIQKVRSVMKTCDPIDLAELDKRILESELRIKFALCGLSYLLSWHLYLSIPMFCISGAVYFFLITYKISLHTLHLMCRSKQIAKLSKSLGVPYVPVTAFDQERIMAGLVTIMGEFFDGLKKKDKK